ncbi:MAG: hypothetical protein MR015_09715 [Clostridiales bacterium]|nr:hypothetical protein [Clostridiales bacterium]
MILQHAYRPILNFIYDKITFRLNDRTRKILLFVCFFAIFAAQFAAQYIFKFQGFNRGIRDYFICLMMGIIILVSVDRKLEIVKWNLWTYVPFTVTGILLLIASLDHDMGPAYQAFPLAMLVAFMCLFYVWGNRKDYEVLFDAAAGAYALFAAALLVICLVKYPAESSSFVSYDLQYAPFGINPNGTTKVFIAGVVAGLYLLTRVSSKVILIGTDLTLGGSIVVILLTKCRAGVIALVMLAVVSIVYGVMKFLQKKQEQREMIKKWLVRMVFIACGCGIALIMLLSIFSNEATEEAKADPEALPTYELATGTAAESRTDEENNTRDTQIWDKLNASMTELYQNEKLHQLDLFLAGRLAIWNVYFQNMTWRGSSELMFYDTEYAHNQYIELSYKAGIPTGIIYLLFNLIAGVTALVIFFKRRDGVGLLSLSAFIVFFIISMLDTGILPFERGFIFLYYIALTPLFFRAYS